MADKSLKKKNLQKEQYKKKQQLVNSYNAKEQVKIENSIRRKNILKKTGLIFLCVLLSVALILPLSIYFTSRLGQTHKLFMNELVAVQNESGDWGYVNSVGNTRIGFNFEIACPFTKNKLALVKYKGKYGYINKDSEFIIEPIYDEAISFDKNIAICCKDGKYGTINKSGETVTEFKYSNIFSYKDNYAIAIYNNYYGIIDRQGNVIVDFEYALINDVNDNYFKYVKNQKEYIEFISNDKDFESLFPSTEYDFQEFRLTTNGYAIYKEKGLYGLIDGKGKVVFKNIYAELSYTNGDYLEFSKTGDYYGYVDFKGNVIIKDEYDSVTSFSDGLGVVKLKGEEKFAAIDKNNHVKFTLECSNMRGFTNGKAIFKKGNLYGVIDKKGKIIVSEKYLYISDFYDDSNAIFMNSSNKYGIINSKGKEIVEPIFKSIAGWWRNL